MNIFFNKQREIIVAYPIALVFFLLFGAGVVFFLHREDESRAVQVEQAQEARVALWQPATPKGQLPVATYIPILKADATDFATPDAHAAVIIDVDSHNVLFAKNATEHRGIASTTKLLTAMIVVDRVRDLDEYVRVPASVRNIEGTKVGCMTSTSCQSARMEEGEELRVRDLLAAMLMESANDAATLLGIHVAGSEAAFAELMNLRMEELGLTDSHFCRPSGLEVDPPRSEDECYSTAYDIGRVMAHIALFDKYKVLRDIMVIPEKTIVSRDGTIEHELKSTNRIMEEAPYITAAKTGFTPRAGFSLVALAQKSDTPAHHVVVVVLDDYERFNDIQRMALWAFENHMWQ